jgi:uncharacterized protein (TIGR02058 family)
VETHGTADRHGDRYPWRGLHQGGLRDALWHNSLSVADAVGLPVDSMRVEVTIGVPHPEQVDRQAVLAVLPHGTGTVQILEGGLEIANDSGTNKTVIANAAALVRLDVP